MNKMNGAVWINRECTVVCPYLGGNTECRYFERNGNLWKICKFKNVINGECESKDAIFDIKIEAILEGL